MVITIAKQASDDVSNKILKLSTYRLQIILVKYEYLLSLQLCEDQDIRGKPKGRFCKHVLSILKWKPGLLESAHCLP